MLIIFELFNRAQEVAIGVLKLVNKAVGSSKEVVEQNKEKLVLRSNMELRKKITEFYYQPDVSYTCPGKNLYYFWTNIM